MAGKLKFRGSWRSYQKRILEALSYHLKDAKLHVVAAPGAGKTTLGIEVISRLNAPSVILCPTNTIKNQWKLRICSSFLEEKDFDLVSTDIRNPKFITVITYQALLAAFKGEDIQEETSTKDDDEFFENIETMKGAKKFNQNNADKIINTLKSAKVSVLCFDEAHHLRKEWWKALTYLVENLKPNQTLALTATPPYDVEPDEWGRYEELCGTIDEIISIPELVQTGDLCPHQDFIHFSGLEKAEIEMVEKYNRKIGIFIGKIFSDKELFEYLKTMSFLEPSEEDVSKILDDPDFYVSIMSILNSAGVQISKKLLKLFGAKQSEIPKFDLNRVKIFLNGFIISNKSEFPGLESKIEDYYNLAKHLGLVRNNKIVLNESDNIRKSISNSIGKLASVVEITKSEYASLGKALRMVILADYIRENDIGNSSLGVMPIWRTLKQEFGSDMSIGVLCGSVILLPNSTRELLNSLLEEYSLTEDVVTVSVCSEDENYIKITPKESAKNLIVTIVTEIFNRGGVNVLTGTQSLLGEGWDAPCINSLILSSTVSSYMLSNQMRGRAIRVDKDNPDKVSNIWHLASVKIPELKDYLNNSEQSAVSIDYESDIFDAAGANLYDIKQLEKRFEGFEAPSYFGDNEIISGIDRVISRETYLQAKVMGENAFINTNSNSLKMAADREGTRQKWINALKNAGDKHFGEFSCSCMSPGVNVPKMSMKSLNYASLWALYIKFCSFFVIACLILLFYIGIYIVYLLPVLILVFISVSVYFLFKWLKTGTPSKMLRQIAYIMLETAYSLGLVSSGMNNRGIRVDVVDILGSLEVSYKGLPVEDNNFLMKCLQEFLDPVENPRYVLVSKYKKGIITQTDYYSLPSAFSTKKRDTKVFIELWKKNIGRCEVVYTRNYEGRRLLLKARQNAFSGMKREKSKRLSKWQ